MSLKHLLLVILKPLSKMRSKLPPLPQHRSQNVQETLSNALEEKQHYVIYGLGR